MKSLLTYLRELRVAPSAEPERDESPRRRLLLAYERYLTRERSLRPATVTKYLHIATEFLAALPDPFADTVSGLSAEQVTAFICEKDAGAKSIAGGLRVFLRYLYLSGNVDRRLAEAVPPAAGWRLSGLPSRLDTAVVAAVLATCNRTSEAGRRDYAILMLLARLGLRAHEVAGLELEDIHWRAGTVVLRRKGGRDEELPLPVDVGQALADYLLIRPAAGACRAVFMSVVAPRRPATRSAVTLVARRRCAAAGVVSGGAHRLRHTLASDLLAAGASLAEIGLVLGHRSPFVTSIYAKLDRAALAELVRPWPLSESREPS
jgi:integrase/recombinase XerD